MGIATDSSKGPVIIIGAGPTGTALAIDLALRGTPSMLIERHDVPQRIPKGQNLTQRSGEHLQVWGVTREIKKATLIPPEYGNEGLVAYGSLLSGYHYDWFKRKAVSEFYFADNERLPQFETERILRERAAQFDCIDMQTGWSYVSHESGDGSVTVQLKQTKTCATKALSGSFIVGCDGARSLVRDSACISLSSTGTQRRMALLVFHSQELHELLENRFPGKTIFNALDPLHQGYWQFFGRVDLSANWFFHAPVPEAATLDTFDFTNLLYGAVGKEFNFSLSYKGFWDLRFSHADTYRQGRVFIAGDAAHSHPPYGGYGVNTGFEDARNLSWKLAAHYHGWGTSALLDSYSTERHPVFASTRDDFIQRMITSDEEFTKTYSPSRNVDEFTDAWQRRATLGQREVAGYVPHYSGSPIVCSGQIEKSHGKHRCGGGSESQALPGAKGMHMHEPQAGQHLSPLCFRGREILMEQLSNDFTLLYPQRDEALRDRFHEAATTLGVPLRTRCIDSLSTLSPVSAAARGSAPDRPVLVRPDHFIGWVGQSKGAETRLDTTDARNVLAQCAAIDI